LFFHPAAVVVIAAVAIGVGAHKLQLLIFGNSTNNNPATTTTT